MLVKSKKTLNQGQALIEFVIAFPVFIFFLISFISIAGSINTAINQQKAVRAYFYFFAKGNSRLPDAASINKFKDEEGVTEIFGFDATITADRGDGAKAPAYAPCFPLRTFGNSQNQKCDDKSSGTTSNIIKVFTAYGLCGATYVATGTGAIEEHFPVGGESINGLCVLR